MKSLKVLLLEKETKQLGDWVSTYYSVKVSGRKRHFNRTKGLWLELFCGGQREVKKPNLLKALREIA